MKEIKLTLSVESQKELLDIKLELGIITKEEYDNQVSNLKPQSVGVLIG